VEVRATLDADPRHVADARRLTERTLATWGLTELGDTAALLVSELVTNAILHAHSGVAIILQLRADDVQIRVCDTSPLPPRIRRFRADAGTGRGIRLLETLASSWGIERNAEGKCVWFRLTAGPPAAVEDWAFDLDAVEPL
jgi:anti-sigma regulatory factor (Ser/Thr protein kinase)